MKVSILSPFLGTPYLNSLESALQELAVQLVSPCQLNSETVEDCIVHVQWPDGFSISRKPLHLTSKLRELRRVVHLSRQANRSRLVTTVHNLRPHETNRLAAHVTQWTVSRSDRVVVLSKGGIGRLTEVYPALDRSRFKAIPHMDWRDRYTLLERPQAEHVLRYAHSSSGVLLGWFGLIRPYKGIDLMAESFAGDPATNVNLLLMGAMSRGTRRLKKSIESLECDPRVLLRQERISDLELSALCSLSDAIWLPYARIENSGAAMAALSVGCPVVVPNIGSMAELRDDYGPEFVRMYEHQPTLARLAEIVGEYPRPVVPARLDNRDRLNVGDQHLELYEAAWSSARIR